MILKHKIMEQAGADGAAAGGASGEGAGTGAPAAPAGPWYGTFQNAELKGYAESKGWASPEVVVDGFRNLEKLTGVPADQLLRLPKEGDTEGWNKVYDRLGRPAKAEDYKLPTLPGDNGDYAKAMAAEMHKLGIPLKAAQALAAANNAFLQQQMDGGQKVRTEQFATEHKALMKEWGQAAEKNTQIVDGVADRLGISDQQLAALRDSLGPAGAMKFLYNIGTKLGEDNFVTNGDAPNFKGMMTPAAAQSRIAELRADPTFAKKYINGDAEARKEMQRLHEMAYPTERGVA